MVVPLKKRQNSGAITFFTNILEKKIKEEIFCVGCCHSEKESMWSIISVHVVYATKSNIKIIRN